MARRGENIYKRKDGRYEGRYVIGKSRDGKTRFGYVYGRLYHDVRRRLTLMKAEQTDKQTQPAGYRGTVSDWMHVWMRDVLSVQVKPSSYQVYLGRLERHILPALGQIPLAKLSATDVREFLDKLLASGLAASTVSGIYRLLAAALRYAHEDGLLTQNPCRKIRLSQNDVTEQHVLNRQEQRKIRDAATAAQDLPALLSLYTGMRLGEVCALAWSDIDWARKTIVVRRTVQRLASSCDGAKTKLTIGTPKTRQSRRHIPVPDFILERLAHMRKDVQGEFVFGNRDRAAEPRTIQRRLKKLAERLNMTDVHFHTLRHTFETRLFELGVDVKTVSALLGHSSAKTTLDFYAHSLMENRRRAVQLLISC